MTGADIVAYRKKYNLTQQEFADLVGVSKNTISNYEGGSVIPKSKLPILNNVLSDIPNIGQNQVAVLNPTKDDVLLSLKQIQKKRKDQNQSEGKLIDESSLVAAVQYIVPIPGQAGIKKAFFAPDEYIEQNFTKEIIYVKPSERGIYHKIEVDGDSMPGIVDKGDWARCEDIPRTSWIDPNIFKKDKVYCLFHRTKGILFKRISKRFLDSITLSSDNTDKVEYPDQTFDLNEFSKILIVRVVEKRL